MEEYLLGPADCLVAKPTDESGFAASGNSWSFSVVLPGATQGMHFDDFVQFGVSR